MVDVKIYSGKIERVIQNNYTDRSAMPVVSESLTAAVVSCNSENWREGLGYALALKNATIDKHVSLCIEIDINDDHGDLNRIKEILDNINYEITFNVVEKK